MRRPRSGQAGPPTWQAGTGIDHQSCLRSVVVLGAFTTWRASSSQLDEVQSQRLERLVAEARTNIAALPAAPALSDAVKAVGPLLGVFWPSRPDLAGITAEAVEQLRIAAMHRPPSVAQCRQLVARLDSHQPLTGKSPALANSYAFVRPMPKTAAAVSISVVMPSARMASWVQLFRFGRVMVVVRLRCHPRSPGSPMASRSLWNPQWHGARHPKKLTGVDQDVTAWFGKAAVRRSTCRMGSRAMSQRNNLAASPLNCQGRSVPSDDDE
jgi:hypothetical protein